MAVTLPERKASWRSWLIVLSASMFFFYEFLQMNMFNAISHDLIRDFNMSAAQLGQMSAFYFLANVIFLVPAGILLDRFSTRRVILLSLALCVLGTLLLSQAESYRAASLYRFMTGIGSAFCFLSVIRLASRWFPATRMAMITGIVVTIAMAGGMMAQTPMAWLASVLHWRQALWVDVGFGVLVWMLIAALVQDYPPELALHHQQEQQEIKQLGYWRSLHRAFLRMENWLVGVYVCFMNLPVGLLGGLWGSLYLQSSYGFSTLQANNISMMLFLGTIVGGPINGWISDRLRLRRLPMLVGTVLAFSLMLAVIALQAPTVAVMLTLFFLLGVVTSTQIIGYPLVAENSPRFITAMSVSVVNISVQGGDGLFQPMFGYLLDAKAFQRLHSVSDTFIGADFQWAMWLFPIGFLLAFLAILSVRETHCVAQED